MDFKPQFDQLDKAKTFIRHRQELVATFEPVKHGDILKQLLEQLKHLDFELLAFPEMKSLLEQITEIEQKLLSQDGSIKIDAALDADREQLKKLQKIVNSYKLNTKHYQILSIENLLLVADGNKWGICRNHNFIYLFNGAYWSEIDKEAIQEFLGQAAEKMGVTKFSARYFQFKEQLFKQFIGAAYLPTPQPPKDLVLINLKNGTFEISPKRNLLRQFNRADFITYQLPFDYDPDAKAPQFAKYLDHVLPDKERQLILAEYLGYIFIQPSTLKLEKVLLLYGTGANGKSVFFEVVTALLGSKNVSNFTLPSLTNDNGYYRAKISNMLLNYVTEINGKLEAAMFKQLASGEPVEARLPYGEPFTVDKYAKLMFNCNELPRDVEQTNAFFRRFLIVPFDVTIPESEQDRELPSKIIANEMSGVFNWVLSGLERLLKQKRFSDCEAARLAGENYKLQSDSVKLFLDETGYQKSSDTQTLIKELFAEYRSFCIEDGYLPVGKPNFIKRLQSSGVLVERKMIGNVAYLKR
ncbi:phage/plasmid primase, P4 family [Dyadobacter sp. CY326]|uniref:DNA primase family protein n=1 Tax=Dyadobacter sp. CY326 TaxID=2907300 RepID=UPI001F2C3E8A|nr:phage/plasmid primase, P4 family [Dyadobacter sp. CY326]MCE7064023.1 phage/plasmid primase, P4 family [Dyadobacter sp. CY326]